MRRTDSQAGATAPASAGGQAPAELQLAVDRDAEIPIGVQIAWALRARIRDGSLRGGERLPGLRELAESTGVNVNTARAVYQRLEREGLIESRQGSGTFVASPPVRASRIAAIVAEATREALETGVDPRDVAAALYVASAPGGGQPGEAAERRRDLREQIAALDRTLGELEARHPSLASPASPAGPAGPAKRGIEGPRLLDDGELEQTRARLLRSLSLLQSAIDGLSGEAQDDQTAEPEPRPAPSGARAKGSGARGKKARGASGLEPAPSRA